jgi:hypothetical protein
MRTPAGRFAHECTNRTPGRITMLRNFAALALSGVLMMSGASFALAASHEKKEMMDDKSMSDKDKMEKDSMSKDSMDKHGDDMKKDTMKDGDDMKKDTMMKDGDGMKKDTMMKDK